MPKHILQMPKHILQLSDMHLCSDPAERLFGVPTRDSFADVLSFVSSNPKSFDAIILTGDLSNDGTPESYEALRDLLGDLVDRCRIIPGNHDSRATIRQVFPDIVPDGDGPLTFSHAVGSWRLIGLDSLEEGVSAGRIESQQLQWLEQQLSAHSDQPTILFMHHPPLSVNSLWLDRVSLQEPERFVQLVTAAPQVKIVCTGHIHHEFEAQIGGARFFSTPSTGLQFEPQKDVPGCHSIPPGFRLFEIDGETCRTQVTRLPELKHPPALDA